MPLPTNLDLYYLLLLLFILLDLYYTYIFELFLRIVVSFVESLLTF